MVIDVSSNVPSHLILRKVLRIIDFCIQDFAHVLVRAAVSYSLLRTESCGRGVNLLNRT
jgi:hypothetical protein